MIIRWKISYLIILIFSLLISFIASISYALLNIFIPEENLPLELGIAKNIGEQGSYIVNIAIDTIIWLFILLLIYSIYKRLGRLKFIIFSILGVIFWIIGTYIWLLAEVYIFHNFQINLFGSGCNGTGFPFMRDTCYNNVLYAFYFLNIFFWFLVIWFLWDKLIIKSIDYLNNNLFLKN